MDWSQIKTLIEGFGVIQWGIVAAIAFLVGTSPQAKGAAKWALSKVPSFKRGGEIVFPPSPEPVDDMPLLIHQMRLSVCDDTPEIRNGVNKHLDEIEQLISSTEIERD